MLVRINELLSKSLQVSGYRCRRTTVLTFLNLSNDDRLELSARILQIQVRLQTISQHDIGISDPNFLTWCR